MCLLRMGLLLRSFPWLEVMFVSLLPSWLLISAKLATNLYLEVCVTLSNLFEKQALDSKAI